MSNLNTENQVIEGVGFYYTKIQQPALKYQSQTEKEFVVDIHVDKATAKAFKKEFPKQGYKEVEYNEFAEKFGAENAIGDEEQFFIKLKKPANYIDKKTKELTDVADIYRPRVFLDDGEGNLEDVTFTKLVGNGSKGVVQYELYESSFGVSAKLLAIKVDSLIEYESKGGDETSRFSALGNVKQVAKPIKQETAVVSETVVTDMVDADSEW